MPYIVVFRESPSDRKPARQTPKSSSALVSSSCPTP